MRYAFALTATLCTLMQGARAEESEDKNKLQEIIVTATLRQESLVQAPVSAAVLTAETLQAPGQQHLEDVLQLVPNLNWAGGTARPRYFQIRGIGEREQYEGAPNPSVGFLIDDIDFSGIGMPATLFDVDQVEVLRGPQGTRYGANALAGLISVRTAAPSATPVLQANADLADYNTYAAGLVAGGPVEQLSSAWRLAIQDYRSDGFRRDPYLNRHDTNGRDEFTGRLRWRWQGDSGQRLDVTVLRANINDGYDAWSVDNSLVSQADRPGKDSQLANAAAMHFETPVWINKTFTAIASVADSKSVNSYDADWGNPVLWAPFTYDYFFWSQNERRTYTVETRLASAAPQNAGDVAWLIGVYALRLRENIHETSVGTYVDPTPDTGYESTLDEFLDSHYVASNVAAFGQLDGKVNARWRWSLGLRAERRHETYRDAGFWQADVQSTGERESDNLVGGQASVSYDLSNAASAYASISRGYKAGGFNLGAGRLEQESFKPEYLWNYEVGIKGDLGDRRIYAEMSIFYEQRQDVQIRTGVQQVLGDPSSYVFFTNNASKGYNYGVESSLRIRATSQLEFGAAVGLLRTRYQNYMFDGAMLADRDQPHAPHYQFALDATWRHPSGWFSRADFSGKDRFYFDVPGKPDTSSFNDTRSHPYTLTNLQLGYDVGRWSASLWVHNVFDKNYAVRGFYFGNEPPDFPTKLYTQRGDPRQIGVSVKMKFL